MSRPLDNSKKDKILNAALMIFGDLGFAQATMKDIAAKANIASGSIYNYFQDKETLFRSTLDWTWSSFHEEMQSILSADKPYIEKVTHLLNYGFSLLKNITPLMRGMYSEAVKQGLFSERINVICDDFEAFFAEGVDDSAFALLGFDKKKSKYFIKIIISGILLSTAMAPPEELDNEINEIKDQMRILLLNTGDM